MEVQEDLALSLGIGRGLCRSQRDRPANQLIQVPAKASQEGGVDPVPA